MLISYFPTSECVPAVGGTAGADAASSVTWPDAAVVIDVLRATTTIAWSLANGAEAIQAFADLAELEAAASAWPAGKRLRAGERGGKRLEGFDLGNSPLAVTPAVVAGKRLFMSTTNGTRSLDRVRPVGLLVTDAFESANAAPRSRVTVQTYQLARALVEAGAGMTIVDPFTASSADPARVRIRPLESGAQISLFLLTTANAPLAQSARRLVRFISVVAQARLKALGV